MSPQPGNQSNYSSLQGQWTFSFTYTMSGIHLYELQTRWNAQIDVLADPQFAWTQATSLSPAQYALSAHILNVQWPNLGPFIVQSFIDAQWQTTDRQGSQAGVSAGLSIAPRQFQQLQIMGALNMQLWDSQTGMSFRVDPAPGFTAAIWF
jgi:hypothetical protein